MSADGFRYTGVFQDVISICRKRSQDGRQLEKLSLHKVYDVNADCVRELQEVVRRVTWDGYEHGRAAFGDSKRISVLKFDENHHINTF